MVECQSPCTTVALINPTQDEDDEYVTVVNETDYDYDFDYNYNYENEYSVYDHLNENPDYFIETEDIDEEDNPRPIAELRASLYNLCNIDFFSPLPDKAHETIISYLSLHDIRNCRLVSRTWNAVFTNHTTFFVQLTDPSCSNYAFLDIPSLEQLVVSTLIIKNLTKPIKDPHNPSEILLNFAMRSPDDVTKLIFLTDVSTECQTQLLKAYSFVKELSFLRIPFPILPTSIVFSNCTKLTINTREFSSGDETIRFFRQTGSFPVLEFLKLDLYIKDDILMYLGAHYFASSHYKTLKKLILNFNHSVLDVDKYSKDRCQIQIPASPTLFNESETETETESEIEPEPDSKSGPKKSVTMSKHTGSGSKQQQQQQLLQPKTKHLIDMLKKDVQYQSFLRLLPLMKLESLNLSLSFHEGEGPWSLSFKLIDAQKHLSYLKVEYPFPPNTKSKVQTTKSQSTDIGISTVTVEKTSNKKSTEKTRSDADLDLDQDNDFNFSKVVRTNKATLKKISLPCFCDFDITALKDCCQLQSFSIGKEMSFNSLFFHSQCECQGSILNFSKLPTRTLTTVQTISICVPLTRMEIKWLSRVMPVNSLLAYGMETEENYFLCRDIEEIVKERTNLVKIMMTIYMNEKEIGDLLSFFKFGPDGKQLRVTNYFHATNGGFTTFTIQPMQNESTQGNGREKKTTSLLALTTVWREMGSSSALSSVTSETSTDEIATDE